MSLTEAASVISVLQLSHFATGPVWLYTRMTLPPRGLSALSGGMHEPVWLAAWLHVPYEHAMLPSE